MLYKHRHVDEVFRARQLHMSCIEEIARLNREEKKELLLDKFRSFQVSVTKAKLSSMRGKGCIYCAAVDSVLHTMYPSGILKM